MLSKELIKAVSMVMRRAIEVTNESTADIFIDYSPHVSELELRIFENGWARDQSPTIKLRIDLDIECYEKEVIDSQILKALATMDSLSDI